MPTTEQTHRQDDIPKIRSYVKYRQLGDTDWKTAKIVSQAGESSGKHKSWLNVQNLNSETVAVDWKETFDEWEYADSNERQDIETSNVTSDALTEPIFTAKLKELENWKNFDVYEAVRYSRQEFIAVRWVVTEKSTDSGPVWKARLVVRGFQEEQKCRSDSLTTGKDAIRVLIGLSVANNWKCHCVDVKSAFQQGQTINRDVNLLPTEEANQDGFLWKLKKVAYVLQDGSRNWYLTIKSLLCNLGCAMTTCDPAVFFLREESKLLGLLVVHVDNAIWCGSEEFERKIIQSVRSSYKIGKDSFKYLGIDLCCSEELIKLSQEIYMGDLKTIPVQPDSARQKTEPLNKHETKQLRCITGQFNWLSSTTRPNVAYSVLELSASLKSPRVQTLLLANKTVKMTKADFFKLKIPQLAGE